MCWQLSDLRITPQHDKAAGFLRSKLFDKLDSFATLEQRISDLPTRPVTSRTSPVDCVVSRLLARLSPTERALVVVAFDTKTADGHRRGTFNPVFGSG